MASRLAVLVGPDQQDNLALQYLASSVEAAGHRAHLVPYNSRGDLEACAAAVLSLKPDLVGFGIAFQYAVEDYLELSRVLRKCGYEGHITCGGHVPTFCYEQLLRDAPGINTAVRHEGEKTLVEILDCLGRGEEPRGLAGLVWRERGAVSKGPARPLICDLDSLPLPKRRSRPLVVGGVPVAFVVTSRGCMGDCAYCSIRAFGKDTQGPLFRMRDVDSVAEELAGLYINDRVRIFCVQDDLFILPDEHRAVARMEALTRALRKRGVEKAAFWIKGRPESITERVAKTAQEMGAIHLFLGVESASRERLRYLGRTHSPENNRRAIDFCREYGITPSFNFMLFDPECTLGDVSTTLDFAAEHLDLAWNICRTEIYSGTRLHDRLLDQGRLEGDYKSYGYCMTDRTAETMFRILRVSFHKRAFATDSLMNRLISLSFARQVHQVFFPGSVTDALNEHVERLINDVHRDSVDELRRTVDFVSATSLEDTEAIRDFAVDQAIRLNERDLDWYSRYEQLWKQLSARGEALKDTLDSSRDIFVRSRIQPEGGIDGD
jgi:anaerobic magnesium-protoporphyrin IX monomethyl ester cyclase